MFKTRGGVKGRLNNVKKKALLVKGRFPYESWWRIQHNPEYIQGWRGRFQLLQWTQHDPSNVFPHRLVSISSYSIRYSMSITHIYQSNQSSPPRPITLWSPPSSVIIMIINIVIFYHHHLFASRDSVERPLFCSAWPTLHALRPLKCRTPVSSIFKLLTSAAVASALSSSKKKGFC